MTTIVNTPAPASSGGSDNSSGTVIALVLVLVIGVLFFVYGLPMLRRATATPQVSVPDQIDVNVNTPNSGN